MAAQPLAVQVGVAPACQALGVSRATFYRRQRPTPGHQQPRPTPARALCESEREHILDVLACPQSPVYADIPRPADSSTRGSGRRLGDVFSRYRLDGRRAGKSALAGRLIEQTCHKQGVQPRVLTLHY